VKINAAKGNMRSFIEALEGEEMLPEFTTLRLALGLPDLRVGSYISLWISDGPSYWDAQVRSKVIHPFAFVLTTWYVCH
jgi:hypothetical protein